MNINTRTWRFRNNIGSKSSQELLWGEMVVSTLLGQPLLPVGDIYVVTRIIKEPADNLSPLLNFPLTKATTLISVSRMMGEVIKHRFQLNSTNSSTKIEVSCRIQSIWVFWRKSNIPRNSWPRPWSVVLSVAMLKFFPAYMGIDTMISKPFLPSWYLFDYTIRANPLTNVLDPPVYLRFTKSPTVIKIRRMNF